MTEQQILKASQIRNHYGRAKQQMQAVQELTELILLLAQRPEQKKEMDYVGHMVDEIADVTIMLEQLRQMYEINPIEIEQRITMKLNRQLERIEKEVYS